MTDNLRGIIAVLIASTAFVMNDALVKLVSAELPSGEIIVLRGLLATGMLTVGVFALRASRPLSILLAPMMLVRLMAAAGATAFIVLSLRYLPLATAATVLQATPLAVTAGAATLYGETVGWRRWAAALTGFAGVVLIVRPGGEFGAAVYLILIALVFTTARDLSTRGLHQNMPSIFVAAASAAAVMLIGFAVAPFDAPWTMPTPWAWGVMTIAAACLFVANTLLITGLRTGEIAVIAPFRYAPVPLSLVLGWWWWDDVPDAAAFLGIALVLAAGLYTLHRERASLRVPPVPAAQRSPAE